MLVITLIDKKKGRREEIRLLESRRQVFSAIYLVHSRSQILYRRGGWLSKLTATV